MQMSLISNAANGTSILKGKPEAVDRLMKVNLTSHLVLIPQFLPGMLKAKKGHIVTIASMASFAAAPGLVDYCCSKVGALFLTEGEIRLAKLHYVPLMMYRSPKRVP